MRSEAQQHQKSHPAASSSSSKESPGATRVGFFRACWRIYITVFSLVAVSYCGARFPLTCVALLGSLLTLGRTCPFELLRWKVMDPQSCETVRTGSLQLIVVNAADMVATPAAAWDQPSLRWLLIGSINTAAALLVPATFDEALAITFVAYVVSAGMWWFFVRRVPWGAWVGESLRRSQGPTVVRARPSTMAVSGVALASTVLVCVLRISMVWHSANWQFATFVILIDGVWSRAICRGLYQTMWELNRQELQDFNAWCAKRYRSVLKPLVPRDTGRHGSYSGGPPLCIGCLAARPEYTCQPCGHIVYCEGCRTTDVAAHDDATDDRRWSCPQCRGRVTRYQRVFW